MQYQLRDSDRVNTIKVSLGGAVKSTNADESSIACYGIDAINSELINLDELLLDEFILDDTEYKLFLMTC